MSKNDLHLLSIEFVKVIETPILNRVVEKIQSAGLNPFHSVSENIQYTLSSIFEFKRTVQKSVIPRNIS